MRRLRAKWRAGTKWTRWAVKGRGGAEAYGSGYGGTYAGQPSNAGAMLWKMENLRVLVDDRNGAGYQDIGLTSTTNSNGSIILIAQGTEYSMCR